MPSGDSETGGIGGCRKICEDGGKRFLPINTPDEGTRAPTDYTVTFRRLSNCAPELQ